MSYPAGRPTADRTYVYDPQGNLRAVEAADGAVGYTYDALNRVSTELSNGATHQYGYDLTGNRVMVVYGARGGGAGRSISSTYDSLNRLSILTEGTRISQYGYDLNGNIVAKTLPDGETVRTEYDGLNRQVKETGSSYSYTSSCDAVGNLRFSYETTSGVPSRTMLLNYDRCDRLIGEQTVSGVNKTVVTYAYDAAHNRSSKKVGQNTISYSYNSRNQLTGWSDTSGHEATYAYDGNGNRVTRTAAGLQDAYSYDAENRLIGLMKNTPGGEGAYAYGYDYRTRRVFRSEPAGTTAVVFSGGTSVQEYGADPVEFIRGSDWGGGVGGVLYSLRSNTPSFAHYNRRGDVIAHTDATGALTYQASYEAGGTRTAEFGATQDRQKANTKEEDPTGLLNEGMRYRDLETDTFITKDPAGFVDGPNVYCYVKQNPWTKFDPEGLWEEGGNGAKVLRDGKTGYWHVLDGGTDAPNYVYRAATEVRLNENNPQNLSRSVDHYGNSLAESRLTMFATTILREVYNPEVARLKWDALGAAYSSLLDWGGMGGGFLPPTSPKISEPAEVFSAPKNPTSEVEAAKPLKTYHRLETATQTPEVAAKQEATGEIWGRPSTGPFASDIPKVKAFPGALPEGARGVEFQTSIEPYNLHWGGGTGGTMNGLVWSEKPGVWIDGDYAKMKVNIIKNTQTQTQTETAPK